MGRHPPASTSFQDLFDHIWTRGLGNSHTAEGIPLPWTAETLSIALGGDVDPRTIENWSRGANRPSPRNIARLARLIAPEDISLRHEWYDALSLAARSERRVSREARAGPSVKTPPPTAPATPFRYGWHFVIAGTVAITGVILSILLLWPTGGLVTDIRICDAPYFDENAGKCTQHVPVFVHGIEEVFLSFDLPGVPYGDPFERWWILNHERIAGRTSFNDEAWPGWTYWRPGTLQIGQYVVRIVVEGQVFTQTFQVQADGFWKNNSI